MSDLVKNHIVGFPTRWLKFKGNGKGLHSSLLSGLYFTISFMTKTISNQNRLCFSHEDVVILFLRAATRGNGSLGVPTRSDTNQSVQPQRMA